MRKTWLGSAAQERQRTKPEERLRRLAARIESLAEKDEQFLRHAHEIGAMRQKAAVELHSVCASFAAEINRLLPQPEVVVDPPEFDPTHFNEDGANLIQVNVRGRIMQLEYEATGELISTEDFRVPYTLSGSIRCFNQQLLDRSTVEEQLIFYCLEKKISQWRFFDARTYRSGPLDRDYLVSLFEQLI